MPDGKMKDNAPVNVDATLLSILGRGGERFGMAAAVLRGERIIAQGAAGVRKRGTAERITLDDRFYLGSCTKAMTATLVAIKPSKPGATPRSLANRLTRAAPPRNSRCSTAPRAWHT